MAKLKKNFSCVPNGEIYPRMFEAGEDCPQEHVDAARSLGLIDDSGAVDGSDDPSGAGDDNKGEKKIAAPKAKV